MRNWNLLNNVRRKTAIIGGFASAILLAASGGALIASTMPAAEPAPRPAAKAEVPQPKPVPVKAVNTTAPVAAPTPERLVVKRILDIDGPIKFGDYHWSTEGVPADGPLVITVDLEAQTMSVFRDGYEIGATAVIYGADEKPTPLGQYTITQKKVHHISNLYGAPMPYMMRLTNDGVAIHASDVDARYATHGCIGVPLAFAKLIFAQAKLGDRVIITRGKRLGLGGTITS